MTTLIQNEDPCDGATCNMKFSVQSKFAQRIELWVFSVMRHGSLEVHFYAYLNNCVYHALLGSVNWQSIFNDTDY